MSQRAALTKAWAHACGVSDWAICDREFGVYSWVSLQDCLGAVFTACKSLCAEVANREGLHAGLSKGRRRGGALGRHADAANGRPDRARPRLRRADMLTEVV